MQRFALEAVNAVEGCDEVAIFSCTNSRRKRRIVRHAGYYALNLLAVVNPWTRIVPFDLLTKRVSRMVAFESGYDGDWQKLPEGVVRELRGYDIVLKAGMGLLRVPEADALPVPILSFHHGDPDRYRGRPSGFWEMLAGDSIMGQVVQVIGNRLDGGRVVACAETRVLPWSYRATLIESYRHSPLIINKAIRAALAGQYLAKPAAGRNYRLPSNLTVLSFALRMAVRYLRHLAYGALFEKAWRVSATEAPGALTALSQNFPAIDTWHTLAPAPGYSFYADPFFSKAPKGLLVEALRTGSGLGEILFIDEAGRHRRVSPSGGHFSYPFTFAQGGSQFVLPEMSEWSSPKLFILREQLEEAASLCVEGDPRLVDPTMLSHHGRLYLFASVEAVGANVLWLWWSEGIDQVFRLHPAGPIRISPQGSRMGGGIVADGGRLYRLGQDFRSGYGDGLCLFRIDRLSPTEYGETFVGDLRFRGRKGPHTLNRDGDRLLFDWYHDRFAPLAGIRRLRARLRAGRRTMPAGK